MAPCNEEAVMLPVKEVAVKLLAAPKLTVEGRDSVIAPAAAVVPPFTSISSVVPATEVTPPLAAKDAVTANEADVARFPAMCIEPVT